MSSSLASKASHSQHHRVLHLINSAGGRGNGIVHVAIDLAVSQAQAGHRVYLAADNGSYVPLLIQSGVHFIPLKQTGPFRLSAALAFFRLMGIVRQYRIEIIHAHNMTGALLGRLVSTVNGWFGRKVRVVTTVHNSWAFHALLMSAGHRVIAVTKAVGDEMVARGIPAKKIAVVVNGPVGTIRSGDEHHDPVEPITLRRPCVLSVAGMYERKGIRDLIDAAVLLRDRVPHVAVYFAGDGPDRAAFEAYARQRKVEDIVTFLGFRPDAHDLMRQADVFVLASHAEPAALVLAEARSVGTPVVASDVGGMPEMLDHGAGGTLVPPRDPARLADALAPVLLDPALAAELSRRGLEGIERFHVKRMSQETLDVYREALAV